MTTEADTYIKCKGCGVQFIPARKWQKFHDALCQRTFWRIAMQRAAELVRQDDREKE